MTQWEKKSAKKGIAKTKMDSNKYLQWDIHNKTARYNDTLEWYIRNIETVN